MKSIIALMILASLFAGVNSFIPNQASCSATEKSSTSHDQNTDDVQSCQVSGHVTMKVSGTCFLCIDMLLPDQSPQQNEASVVAIVDSADALPLRMLALPWQPPA